MTVAASLGFPPLAGLAGSQDAKRMGYSVEQNTQLLLRYVYLHTQLNRVMVAHIAAAGEWEMKQALSLHQWQDAEHGLWLRERIRNMRNPAPDLNKAPDPQIEAFAQELLRASDSLELAVGLYQVIKPALLAAYQRHLDETNPVADYPSVRTLRFIMMELEEQIAWGQVAVDVLIRSEEDQAKAQAWADHLGAYLNAAGGVRGDEPIADGAELPAARAAEPFEPVRHPQRDERFSLVSTTRGYGPPPDADVHEMNAWTVYKLLTEMHAPEMLGLYSYDSKDKPWEFYRDVGRHLWDECRHSMLGQIAFERRGLDWTKVNHDVGFCLFPSVHMEPIERYILLVATEQGLMGKNGKARQYSYAVDSGDAFARQCNDYDWADEVLHVQIGRKWLTDQDPDLNLKQVSPPINERYRQLIDDHMHMTPDPAWWDAWYADLRAKDGLPPKADAGTADTEPRQVAASPE